MTNPPVIFLWPASLLLFLLALFVFFYLARVRSLRRKVAERKGTLAFLMQPEDRASRFRRRVPGIFFLLGMLVLIVALARPQTVLNLPEIKQTVILAFDVSGSMAADDVKPTRLEAAKAVAKDFVTHQPATVQIGIVDFSDSGFSVQVPTNDQSALLASIDRIHTQRGTSLANGIMVSLDTIAREAGQTPLLSGDFSPNLLPTPTPVPAGSNSSAVIVLITDGENNMAPDPLQAAQAAADRGVRVNTIGIGSPTGANLEVNGFMVHTQLDDTLLQQISSITQGTYSNAQSQDDLRAIYAGIKPTIVVVPEKTEVTSILAGLGMLLMLVGAVFSLVWFNRVP